MGCIICLPIIIRGKPNEGNTIILNHNTEYEKANNYPEFEVVGVRYIICHDESDDFYYIEKIMKISKKIKKQYMGGILLF